MITDEVKEAFVLDLMKKNLRMDQRGLLDYRPIRVDKNLYENTEGSALAHVGDSKVLAGVKFDIVTPFPDRPTEGAIMFNAEFSPIAHPDFEPGPPNEKSIELARVVDRGIRSAEIIDVKKLFLEEGKALGVFVDLFVLDHSGNLIDTAYLATMSALKNTKMPKYEGGKIIRGEYSGNLPISRDVVSCSFEKINGSLVLDAREEEETSSSGRLTLATCGDETVCAGQKSGKAGFSKDEIMRLVDISLQKRSELLKYL